MPKQLQFENFQLFNFKYLPVNYMEQRLDHIYTRAHYYGKFDALKINIFSKENMVLAYQRLFDAHQTFSAKELRAIDQRFSQLTVKECYEQIMLRTNYFRPGKYEKHYQRTLNNKHRLQYKFRPQDTLIQQMIMNIFDPICESYFSNNSFGGRMLYTPQNALQKVYFRMQRSKMHYAIKFDLLQMYYQADWNIFEANLQKLGIIDKRLLHILKRMARVNSQNKFDFANFGIARDMMFNIYLYGLDRMLSDAWETMPEHSEYKRYIQDRGEKGLDQSHAYRAMRRNKISESYFVRYLDELLLFAPSFNEVANIKYKTTDYLKQAYHFDAPRPKYSTLTTNYTEFLGFKMKLVPKSQKWVVRSHMTDASKKHAYSQLKGCIKTIQHGPWSSGLQLYNKTVLAIQNYYAPATMVYKDLDRMQWNLTHLIKNRLRSEKGVAIRPVGRKLTKFEQKRFGHSRQIRYLAGINEPIYPIGVIKTEKPMAKKRGTNLYTIEGRKLYSQIRYKYYLATMPQVWGSELTVRKKRDSMTFFRNRAKVYEKQKGLCAVTGLLMTRPDVHHVKPKSQGGSDKLSNLVCVLPQVHKLIHAKRQETINKYLAILQLNQEQLDKLNYYRKQAGNSQIVAA